MWVWNKRYNLGVCGRIWGQQAAVNHLYLPTKLHFVYHARLTSERTLSHISITCGIAPSYVWRSSSFGMWRCDTKRLSPEVVKHCSALEMSKVHTRWHNVTPKMTHFQQHSCEILRSHKSPLPCMCSSSEVLLILPFLMWTMTYNDTAWGCHMLLSHKEHYSESSN